jgi:hypothetical protein
MYVECNFVVSRLIMQPARIYRSVITSPNMTAYVLSRTQFCEMFYLHWRNVILKGTFNCMYEFSNNINIV